MSEAIQQDAVPKDRHRRPRHWLRFSLRSTLIVFLLAGLGFGYVSKVVHQSRREQESVAKLREMRCAFRFAHEVDSDGKSIKNAPNPGPAWLRYWFGDQLFHTVRDVRFTHLFWSSHFTSRPNAGWHNPPRDVTGQNKPLHSIADERMPLLRAFRNLESLDISATPVTDMGMVNLNDLRKLELLYMNSTEITDQGLAHLGHARLRQISLASVNITGEGLTHLRPDRLEWLVVTHSQVTEAGLLASLNRFRNMKHLDLGNTRTTDAVVASLVDLPLVELNLAETWVTDASVPHLSRLKSLKKLNVAETKISSDCVQRLKSALPAAEITGS